MRLAVVFGLALTACLAPPHEDWDYPPQGDCDRTFAVSSAFTAAKQRALSRAVDRWNAIGIEQFCLVEKDVNPATHDRVIFQIEYNSDYWKSLSRQFGNAYVLGVHFGADDSIGLVDTMPVEMFERVAVHELGHARGLGHTQCPSLMCSYDGTAEDFTPVDIEECKRVGACAGGSPILADIVPRTQL